MGQGRRRPLWKSRWSVSGATWMSSRAPQRLVKTQCRGTGPVVTTAESRPCCAAGGAGGLCVVRACDSTPAILTETTRTRTRVAFKFRTHDIGRDAATAGNRPRARFARGAVRSPSAPGVCERSMCALISTRTAARRRSGADERHPGQQRCPRPFRGVTSSQICHRKWSL